MPGRLRDRRGVGWLPVAFPGDVLVLSRWHVDPKSSRRPTPAPSKSFAACSPAFSLSPPPLPGVSGVPPSVDFTSPLTPSPPHPPPPSPSVRSLRVPGGEFPCPLPASRAPQAYPQLWMALSGEMLSPKRALSRLERHFSKGDPSREFVVLLVDELDYMVSPVAPSAPAYRGEENSGESGRWWGGGRRGVQYVTATHR